MKRLVLILLVLASFCASAQIKISQFPAYSGFCDTCYVPVLKNGENYKMRGRFLFGGVDSMYQSGATIYYRILGVWHTISTSSASATWGTIGGSLSAQADLMAALNGKEPTIPSGTFLQYVRGNKTIGTLSTDMYALGDARYVRIGDSVKANIDSGLWHTIIDSLGIGVMKFKFPLNYNSVNREVTINTFTPAYNANRLQGNYVEPSTPSVAGKFLGYDIINGIWRPMTPDSASFAAVDLSLYALQNALIDTAHNLRNLLPQSFYAKGPLIGSSSHVVNNRDTVKMDEGYLDSSRFAIDFAYNHVDGDFVTYPDFYSTIDSLAGTTGALGVDSITITGLYNKTATTYYHNGATYSYPFIDLTGGGFGRLYYNGYGLLKPNDSTLTADTSLLATKAWLAAYHYTKAQADARFVSLTGSYANPAWITSLDYAKINGGVPNAAAFFNSSGVLTGAPDFLYGTAAGSQLSITNTNSIQLGGLVLNGDNGGGGSIQVINSAWPTTNTWLRNSLIVGSNTGTNFITSGGAAASYYPFKWVFPNTTIGANKFAMALWPNKHLNVGDTTDSDPTYPYALIHTHLIVADSAIIGGVSSGGTPSNITGLITAGTSVSITGSGTSGSPYVINSSGGGSSLTEFKEEFTSLSTTTKTLSHAPAYPAATLLFYNNGSGYQPQSSSQYSISGTTLTLSFTPTATDTFILKYSY